MQHILPLFSGLHLLIATLFILFILSCTKDATQPDFSLSVTDNIDIEQRVPLIDMGQFVHSGVVLYDVDTNPQILDVLQMENGHYLIYDNMAERLYYWDKKKEAQTIGLKGTGPNDIESGFRLVKSEGKYYLLQRARKSVVICDNSKDCKLHAAQSFENLVTYYESRENGSVVSVEHFVPGKGRISVYKDGEKFYKGGFYSHPDNELARDLNSSVLVKLADHPGYVQLFSLSPHIVYLDENLEVQKVFQLQSFDRLKAQMSTIRRESNYNFNFDQEFSQIAWYYQTGNGNIMIIVRHAEEVALSAHPMDRELVTKNHDYYRFFAETGTMEYNGSSEKYIIPLETGFLMIEDYVLHYYESVNY